MNFYFNYFNFIYLFCFTNQVVFGKHGDKYVEIEEELAQ